MTLDMPTPESLEAEAADMERRATIKETLAGGSWVSAVSADLLCRDASIFREEAAAKRAKAQRLLMKDIEAGIRTPSGTLVSTIEAIHDQRQKHWEDYLGGKEEDFS